MEIDEDGKVVRVEADRGKAGGCVSHMATDDSMRVRSGDEGEPFGGSRVGESSLRRKRKLLLMASTMLTHLARAW